MAPPVHGGLDHAELTRLGLEPGDVLDFSVNGNPFGPPPRVHDVWEKLHLERYPDRECLALRDALAAHHACAAEHVCVGNGTSELIWLLVLAYVCPGDPLLIVAPTYGEYARAGRVMGAHVEAFTTHAQDGFRPDTDALVKRVSALCPRVTFLCNPNNPTGVYLERTTIEALLAANPAGLLVLDEAYVPFVAQAWRSTPLIDTGRLAVLRSMTKDCALAGLRLGYLLAAAEIVDAVRRVQPPWSVNAAAQAAGRVALEEQAHVKRTLARTATSARQLRQALAALGLDVLPSSAHYFLVHVDDASATRAALLEHGLLVRDCTSFGLPAFVRIAPRRVEENQRLISAWCTLLEEMHGYPA